jgi:hypothetical protein
METFETIEQNGYKLYYYTDIDKWQKPVITEYRIFELFLLNKNIPYNYFAFPWATLIDNFKYKKNIELYNVITKYIPSSSSFTVMQHIHYREILFLCKTLNITHVFTSHRLSTDNELETKFSIKIIPFSLYPIYDNKPFIYKPLTERKYLTSFIGHKNHHYISDIRTKINDIFENNGDCFIRKTETWHFNNIVYKNINSTNIENERLYIETMRESKFALCPSGSGPNSIRLWEAISYGTVPVLLSDNFMLPEVNYDYARCILFWKESDIELLYDYLKNFDPVRLKEMSQNCMYLYNTYFSKDNMHKCILEYFMN